MSFDVGSTLFEWLERAAPEIYAAIIAADYATRRRFGGHGNAIAMPYHHIILPLATRRDKVTEVRWGIADFTRRFGHAPEGMWLPETAVDEETLDVVASEGIRFTILAPHQIEDPSEDGGPIVFTTSSGRALSIFTYNGAAAADVAFGQVLEDPTGLALADTMTPKPGATITAVATDGETFGHHHLPGAQALGNAVLLLHARPNAYVENYGAILARTLKSKPGRIHANTSWSCPHGIERWRGNCGCHVGPDSSAGHQQWRRPLRDAMNWLATHLHELFEREGATLFEDPWLARDGYGAVVARDVAARRTYTVEHLRESVRGANDPARIRRAAELLEMERAALRMFSSCGWFFDDVTGLETRLVLHIAAYAIELSGTNAFRGEFLSRLAGADQSGAAAVSLVPEAHADHPRARLVGI